MWVSSLVYIDKETEVQRGELNCLRSHGEKTATLAFEPRLSDFKTAGPQRRTRVRPQAVSLPAWATSTTLRCFEGCDSRVRTWGLCWSLRASVAFPLRRAACLLSETFPPLFLSDILCFSLLGALENQRSATSELQVSFLLTHSLSN